ncbi:tetratricopeptide repeat protein [Psychrosphaera sp. 1_MG-2023]|uniref:tetratricopeptide repeat protein n=1 Tax=Psychrosphaera sp. 1_MG-2023 TaxID=3062643 RepID=UPI0026E292F1|nr:tetratricopeptide repeat protein [Psychrosphaera sp. 1_MG-2023]MDO6720767.1 tetratricopeptide repeat protein [Psychrosphaera sp. 1_MG-2023]
MTLSKFQTLFVSLLIVATGPVDANIKLADIAFESGDYQSAITEYKAAAQAGNARALHTLGVIYNQGLGVEQDKNMVISWLTLAAQYDFKNSKKLASLLSAKLSPADKQNLVEQLQRLEPVYGKKSINTNILPQLITNNLSKKVKFSNGDESYLLDIEDDIIDNILDEEDLDLSVDSDFSDEFSSSYVSNTSMRSQKSPYLLIADLSIAADGTVRHIDVIQQYGSIRRALRQLIEVKFAKPIFNESTIPFFKRVRLGLAQQHLNVSDLRTDYKKIYSGIRHITNKRKNDLLTPSDQYLYAVVLMAFDGIKRQADEVETLLRQSADAGVAEAQYVLGSKMYREQTNIKEATHWLIKAAQNGLANAEYLVGELCLTSPWIEIDEHKAHFWLERAAKQGHELALKRSAYIKLNATDPKLRDAKTALTYLQPLMNLNGDNPEILYLMALAYEQQDKRQRADAVRMIKDAIYRAEQRGWDTKEWHDKLTTWTSGGNVTISNETY